MFWIYVLVGTAGVTALVPTLVRSLDGDAVNRVEGFIGSSATIFGAIGLSLGFTEMRAAIIFVVAATFGLVAAVTHLPLMPPAEASINTEPLP